MKLQTLIGLKSYTFVTRYMFPTATVYLLQSIILEIISYHGMQLSFYPMSCHEERYVFCIEKLQIIPHEDICFENSKRCRFDVFLATIESLI